MLGKIGVAISPARAGRVWAVIEAKDGAVFRSDDYGESWIRLSEQSLLRTRPWYYMHITADTQDPGNCLCAELQLMEIDRRRRLV